MRVAVEPDTFTARRRRDRTRQPGDHWPGRSERFSSEWEFAKGLQLLQEAPVAYAAMEHWFEAADWIVWQLTGTYVRNSCTASYKGVTLIASGRSPHGVRQRWGAAPL